MNVMQIGRPRFVTIDEAMAFHALAIAKYGGSAGIRDQGLLEAALAMARQGFGGTFAHAYPFEMAAAYAFHVAKNHPFVDGNKRVALMCCDAFLRMNGWNLELVETRSADAILDLIEGRLDKRAFAEWLGREAKPRPSMELRDFFAALDVGKLVECCQSISAGRSISEAIASRQEADRAIPYLNYLNEAQRELMKAGDERAILLQSQGVLLVAIFRLAEDMGYEW